MQPEAKPHHSQTASGQEKRKLELVRPAESSPPYGSGVTRAVRPDHLLIAVEPFGQVARELPPLFDRHWQESEPDREALPLDPDWDRMFMLASQGMLYVVTARDRGRLAGYIFTLVVPHVYSRTSLQAEIQALWLDPAYRGGWAAMNMLRESERLIRANHVIARFYAAMPGRMTALFRRMGYKQIETVWTKVL